jgi:sugar phosphate isomerase/epimerase
MKLKDRIGIDLGSRIRLEDGVEWAGKNGVRFIDIRLDTADNALPRFNDERGAVIRAACEKYGLKLGLHTNSAVNIAEYSPYVDDAVDRYLEGYIDVYSKLGANWIVVHAGYHFTKDKAARMSSGLERIKRAVAKAEKTGAVLYLENLNKEPDNAEVHYLAHTVEEFRYYFERIDSPNLRLSFTANHAHLVPDGVDGFIDALDFRRVGEVRIADCFRNGFEEHLYPGKGDFDFGHMFKRIEAAGFKGHYTNAFGSLDDMLNARDLLVEKARAAGVAVE